MDVCYFSSWAVYRPGLGAFDADPFLCTHAVFGFAGLSNQTWQGINIIFKKIQVLGPWNEKGPDDDPSGAYCAYRRFVDLKNINFALIVIPAAGGWNKESEDYSNVRLK
ncbi:hypothetical protein HAZT_HAZT007546 [Hyalella azteca]|uniref:GH18 domain-containing protein n=1 Tax=Hyalella azteca TaxID=294128 RepID=A0A6A0H6X3_HYAAZ|nr:hypothetical protein HAZT_HAZT007546 [Hyalella azteca]